MMAADLSAMSKCYAADMANRVAANAVQILGGVRLLPRLSVEKMMRDVQNTADI
jgi:alkylation response protein AidB-like acyl-CoA dehydrogenase